MLNLVFTGYVSREATTHSFSESSNVVNFNVAVNYPTGRKNEDGTEIKEVQFFQCQKWGTNAEHLKIAEYLKKGQKVLITANKVVLDTKMENGTLYNNVIIRVTNVELLSKAKEDKAEEEQVSESISE